MNRHDFLRFAGLLINLAGCSDGTLDAFTSEASLGGANTSGGGANTSGGGANTSGGGGVASSATPLLLDDFEDGDNQTLPSGGWWFPTGDGSSTLNVNYATQSIRSGSSTHALRAFGSGFRGWCFVGLDLPGQPNLDARAYARVSFWARAEPGSSVRMLSVDVLDSTNVNSMDSTAIHFRKDIELVSEWTNYTLLFADFVPTSGSPALRLDRGALATVEFWVFSPDAFDFLLDDVSLLP